MSVDWLIFLLLLLLPSSGLYVRRSGQLYASGALPDPVHGHKLHRELPTEHSLRSLRAQHLRVDWFRSHQDVPIVRLDHLRRRAWPLLRLR